MTNDYRFSRTLLLGVSYLPTPYQLYSVVEVIGYCLL